VILLWLLACTPDPELVVAAARQQVTEHAVRARLDLSVRSPTAGLAVAGTGALVVARPGRFRVDLRDPVGAPVVRVISDGERLAFILPRERKRVLAASAEDALRDATHGAVGVDDMAAVLLRELPMPQARLARVESVEQDVVAWLDEPGGGQVATVIGREQGLPSVIQLMHRLGGVMRVEYIGEDALPSTVHVRIPVLDLEMDAHTSRWAALEHESGAFDIEAPAGYVTVSLEALTGGLPSLMR
jgi:hypothetical protein